VYYNIRTQLIEISTQEKQDQNVNDKIKKHKQKKMWETERFQSLSLAMRRVNRRGKIAVIMSAWWFLRVVAWLEGASAGAKWWWPSWAATTATKAMKRAMKNENFTCEAMLAMFSDDWICRILHYIASHNSFFYMYLYRSMSWLLQLFMVIILDIIMIL